MTNKIVEIITSKNSNKYEFENYKITKLDCGLQIISEHIPHFRSISLGFWIKVGSRNENKEINGITHLIEHLLFKGTKKRSYKDIAIAFDSMGAEFNAFTDKENSCVYADFIDNHLENCLELLFDVVCQPSFLPENIKLEKNVVFEELKMVKDNPSDDIFNYFYEVIFNNHPLSLPILGTKKSLSILDSDIIKNYFSKNFKLESMVISAAGNVDHKFLVDLINKKIKELNLLENEKSQNNQMLGKLDKETLYKEYKKRGQYNYKDFSYENNTNINNKSDQDSKPYNYFYSKKIKHYKGKTITSHFCLGGPGCSRQSYDKYALSLFTNILGGCISSRLFQKIREEQGLSYTIFASNTQYTDTGVIVIYGATSNKNLEKVINLVSKELKDIIKNGFSQRELDIAKENTKGNIVLGVEDISSRMFRLGKSLLIDGRVLTIDEILKKIDNINLEEVNKIAEKYFNPANLSLVTISKNNFRGTN